MTGFLDYSLNDFARQCKMHYECTGFYSEVLNKRKVVHRRNTIRFILNRQAVVEISVNCRSIPGR